MGTSERFKAWYIQERKDCGMRVTSKDKEFKWLWLIIHWFFLVTTFGKMNQFYTGFTTTIGRTVYFPAGWTLDKAQMYDCITLRHEACHVKQYLKYGFGNASLGILMMGTLYLFIPFPVLFAWFRYRFEREAYKISYDTAVELGLRPNIEYYVGLLTGPKYLWTWYSKWQVRNWFRNNCNDRI